MANIVKRIKQDGEVAYRVKIRRKNVDISKTFFMEEDAKLYAFYKERLIDNMENFEVPIKDRITLEQIFEQKIAKIPVTNKREINDVENSMHRLVEIFGDKYYQQITYEEWVDAAKKLLGQYVFKGTKTVNTKRLMSLKTLRKIFSHASSAVSSLIYTGIEMDNLPLKVIQTYITPMINIK